MMLGRLVLVGTLLASLAVSAQELSKCKAGRATVGYSDQPCTGSDHTTGAAQPLFSASTPPAGWSKVAVSDSGALTYYVNFSTVRRTGDRVTMWDLLDSQDVIKLGDQRYLSMNVQREYDCGEEQSRILFISAYSGNMGTGEMVGSEDSVRSWIPHSPRSVGRGLWEVACGRL